MKDIQFIHTLTQKLAQPLPGEDAQYKMAAFYRERPNWEHIMANNPKIGAVMVLLVWKDHTWQITLMKRPPYDGVHGGQISFFGGKQEEQDHSLLHTAMREAQEEGGLDIGQLTYAGALSKLYIQASHFLVQPYIFYANEMPLLQPDPQEVEEVIFIPLHEYHRYKQNTLITVGNHPSFEAPAYIIQNQIIWGATAMMLSELEQIIIQ